MYCFHEPKLSKAFLEIFISACVFYVCYGVSEAFENDAIEWLIIEIYSVRCSARHTECIVVFHNRQYASAVEHGYLSCTHALDGCVFAADEEK